VVVNEAFWRGRRVFLTGHTGFKGAWLSLWLQQCGAELTGFALAPPTVPSLFEEARVGDGMRSILGDIRSAQPVLDAMRAAQPEVVIHMAAQPLVRHSYDHPVETYATNVMGTVHVLEAVRATASVRCVVNVTTDKCYENKEWAWGYREQDPLGGSDPYSSSKACAELVTAAYRASYFRRGAPGPQVAVATARAGNVIGGGDWAADRLVPDALSAFEQQRVVQIRNPQAVRPWQHVLEPLSGYLVLAQKLHEQATAYAEPWNFGPAQEDERTVEALVKALADHWGEGARWEVCAGEHPAEAMQLKLDISKTRERLGWHPRWSLSQAIEHTVAWARQRGTGADARALCLQQIASYQQR
jgi:CDP-glucose 4,6-dehydratase